ncbi:MAG: hypothetical protein NVS3B1_16730 [Marmoricola sp.]
MRRIPTLQKPEDLGQRRHTHDPIPRDPSLLTPDPSVLTVERSVLTLERSPLTREPSVEIPEFWIALQRAAALLCQPTREK